MNALRAMVPILLVSLLAAGCSELRDPEPVIEERLLSETPLGSSKDEVRSYLRSQLGIAQIHEGGPPVVRIKDPLETKGWQWAMWVNLGGYSYFGMDLLSTSVVAHYAFSGDDELLEIKVVKHHEGL